MGHSAEFSFLLASTGLALGVLSPNVFALILSGSIVSVVAAPGWYRVANGIGDWLRRHAKQADIVPLVELAPRPPAVILGYGRVGSVIGGALARRGLSFVAVDEDPDVVRWLREHGRPAILGEADNPFLLDQLGLEYARLLVIALPDALATRIIVEHVRSTYPRLPIIARCHSSEEQEVLLRLGVQEAVVGELELALEMTRFALRRFGVSAAEIQGVLQRLRSAAGGQAEE
jgi:CPA2 family monovalent cation:H+ antiporter-2